MLKQKTYQSSRSTAKGLVTNVKKTLSSRVPLSQRLQDVLDTCPKSGSRNVILSFAVISIIFLTLLIVTYYLLPHDGLGNTSSPQIVRIEQDVNAPNVGNVGNVGNLGNAPEVNAVNAGDSGQSVSNQQNELNLDDDRVNTFDILAPNNAANKFPRSDFNAWIQFNLKENESDEPGVFAKREQIRQTFIKAYQDYDRICHGQDELAPLGSKCHNWIGLGLTLLDSLDTMYIMGLTDVLDSATNWVSTSLNFNIDKTVSFFETVIRCLGGLMSIYDLSGNEIFLSKAQELTDKLMPVFSTANGFPLSEVNLRSGRSNVARWTGGSVLLAEVGTIQLEFQSLSDRINDNKYGQKATDIFIKLDPQDAASNQLKLPIRGQYPIFLDTGSVRFRNSHVTWGAMGDSFYEYLLKFWIYTGKKKNSRYRRMYIESVEGLIDHLLQKNAASGLMYVAEWKNGRLDHKMDELACFTGGTIALGLMHGAYFDETQRNRQYEAALGLGETCATMFHRQASGLSPEFVRFGSSGMSNGVDYYILRPETVETMFYLWRLTGDQKWRDHGWQIYEAIEKNCRVPDGQGAGYAPILNVGGNFRRDPNGAMHSFFLAETLKYLYLLFSNPNVIPLDEFQFNTEAHPIRVPQDTLAPK